MQKEVDKLGRTLIKRETALDVARGDYEQYALSGGVDPGPLLGRYVRQQTGGNGKPATVNSYRQSMGRAMSGLQASRGVIQGETTQRTHTTQTLDLGLHRHMRRLCLQEGKTQMRWTESKRQKQTRTVAGHVRAAQAVRTRQEPMRLPARSGTVPTVTGNKNNKGVLSANQRSLHILGNRMRQRMWEDEPMLSNGRYQHISIDIH